ANTSISHSRQRLVFFPFDLLHLDGSDLRNRPLTERRAKLARLIEPSFAIRFSEHIDGNGTAFFAAAVKHGLEGIVSKLAASCYRSGPTKKWLQVKNVTESDFILLGLERDIEGRPFAHVGRQAKHNYEYAGMAFMTSGAKLAHALSNKADGLMINACAVRGLRRPQATWLKPELRVRVRHLRNAKGLRHASVRAILS